jgi:hypothetical protein
LQCDLLRNRWPLRARSWVGSAEPGPAASLLYVSISAVFVCKVLIGNRAAARNQFLKSLQQPTARPAIMADPQAVIPQLTEKPDFVLKSLAKHQRGQNVSIKVCPFSLRLCNSRKSKTRSFGATCKSCRPGSVKRPTMPRGQKCFSRKIQAIWKLREWRRHTSSPRSD